MGTPEDNAPGREPLQSRPPTGFIGGGDDLYADTEPAVDRPVAGPTDPRTTSRVEADLLAGHVMDPLDMLDIPTVQLLWAQQGQRLLAREDQVAAVATANKWAFTPLDAPLSAQLADQDITAGCPRIARHVCRPAAANGAALIDLTGVTFHRDGVRPVDLRLRTATAGLVDFTSDHHLAVVPAAAQTSSWKRFGGGVATQSADFDARYRVHAQDPLWALIVLNPALMERLIDRWPLTLVIAADQLVVIRPGWLSAAALPDLQRFTDHLAISAQAAKSDRPTPPPVTAAAQLSGWSAWPPAPQ